MLRGLFEVFKKTKGHVGHMNIRYKHGLSLKKGDICPQNRTYSNYSNNICENKISDEGICSSL